MEKNVKTKISKLRGINERGKSPPKKERKKSLAYKLKC